jgi:hypothetical protein
MAEAQGYPTRQKYSRGGGEGKARGKQVIITITVGITIIRMI